MCVWGARSLSYLGHMIGAGYTSVPEARIKAIIDQLVRKTFGHFWERSVIIGVLSLVLLEERVHSLVL